MSLVASRHLVKSCIEEREGGAVGQLGAREGQRRQDDKRGIAESSVCMPARGPSGHPCFIEEARVLSASLEKARED